METGLRLWNEEPLTINRVLARRIGLEEAIVVQQIYYWCQLNRKQNRNYKEGHFWTYNSYTEWQAQFDFWSTRTVRRILTRLVKQGYIITGNYNKEFRDRTKWYRLNGNAFDDFNDTPIVPIPKLGKRTRKNTILDDGRAREKLTGLVEAQR